MGGGLLPIAVVQLAYFSLPHCYREQAPSHIDLRCFEHFVRLTGRHQGKPLPHLALGSIVQSCGSPTMQAARKPSLA